MSENALELHPQAFEDLFAGYSWYLEHSAKAADHFLAEIDRALRLILDGPERWPTYLHGTRRFVLVKFPYSIMYREGKAIIIVYAFAHSRRRPGYWRDRLGWSPPSV